MKPTVEPKSEGRGSLSSFTHDFHDEHLVQQILEVLPFEPAYIPVDEVRRIALTSRIIHPQAFEKAMGLLVKFYDIAVSRGTRYADDVVWLDRKYKERVDIIIDGAVIENPIRTYKRIKL